MHQPSQTTEMPPNHSLALPWQLWISAVCGTLYFITKSWQPFTGSIALKALSIAPLALLAFQAKHRLLGAALCFACLGDVLLDWPGDYFVLGLCAFLVMQLLYVALFARNWRRPWSSNTLVLCMLILFFGVALTQWMLPHLGELAWPVRIYNSALMLMAQSAALAQYRQRWIVWGAMLFMFSDALIGVNRFVMAVPLRDYLVWGTYYLGQLGITLGYLKEMKERR